MRKGFWLMSAVLLQSALGFEPHDCQRAPSCSSLRITKGRAPLVVMLHQIRRLRKVRPRMPYLIGDSAQQIVLNSGPGGEPCGA
jgi:hypothetical protein